MKVTLYDGPREYILVSRDRIIDFYTDDSAVTYLDHLMTNPDNMSTLRKALDEGLSHINVFGADEEITADLARELVRGEMKLIVWREVQRVRPTAVAETMTPRQVEEAARAGRVPPEPEEDTWIEIELLDPDGNPIPNEQYQIELPGGSIRIGRLDSNGRAKVKGIDPGTCKVTFPNVDESIWKRK